MRVFSVLSLAACAIAIELEAWYDISDEQCEQTAKMLADGIALQKDAVNKVKGDGKDLTYPEFLSMLENLSADGELTKEEVRDAFYGYYDFVESGEPLMQSSDLVMLSSVAGEANDDFAMNGRLDRNAFFTWAGKLGIDETSAGAIFDAFDNDEDGWLNTYDQHFMWDKSRPFWMKDLEGCDEE